MAADFVSIFQEEYRALRPRAPMPPIVLRFRRFTSLNTRIRLRDGQIHVSLSDLLEGAPESVIRAIAHILLAKLYKKPIDAAHNLRYKRFSSSAAVTRQTELIRGARGSKRFFGPEGRFFNLEEVFDSLNASFFGGLLGRPELTWSEGIAKRALGHYDAAHNTIVVSRVFDRPSSPRYAIEYLLYPRDAAPEASGQDARPAALRPLARVQSRGAALPATERSADVYQAAVAKRDSAGIADLARASSLRRFLLRLGGFIGAGDGARSDPDDQQDARNHGAGTG